MSTNPFNNNNFNRNISNTYFKFDSTNQCLTLAGDLTQTQVQKIKKIASRVKIIYISTINEVSEKLNNSNLRFDLVDKVTISQCEGINLSLLSKVFPNATRCTMDANVNADFEFWKWPTIKFLDLIGTHGTEAHFDLTHTSSYSPPKKDTPDPNKLLELAGLYEERDEEKAIELYKQAAALGHSDAMVNLGVLYQKKSCEKKDPGEIRFFRGEAIRLYKQAFDLGRHPYAAYNLAVFYEKNDEEEKALEYFTIAANQNVPDAIYQLGLYYKCGMGGAEKNPEKAKECFLRAQELGYLNSDDD